MTLAAALQALHARRPHLAAMPAHVTVAGAAQQLTRGWMPVPVGRGCDSATVAASALLLSTVLFHLPAFLHSLPLLLPSCLPLAWVALPLLLLELLLPLFPPGMRLLAGLLPLPRLRLLWLWRGQFAQGTCVRTG